MGVMSVAPFSVRADSSWEMTTANNSNYCCHQFVHSSFLASLQDKETGEQTSCVWGAIDAFPSLSNSGSDSGRISSLASTFFQLIQADATTQDHFGVAALFDNGTVAVTGFDPDVKEDQENPCFEYSIPQGLLNGKKVLSLASSAGAFAVLLADDHNPFASNLKIWGASSLGGATPSMRIGKKVVAIASCYDGFVALYQDGSLLAWGGPNFAGALPNNFPKDKKVIAIASSFKAFAALFEDGAIFVWGDTEYGGSLPSGFPKGRAVASIASGVDSFAVLFKDGGVYSWNASGKNLPDDFPKDKKATVIAANDYAFAALFENKTVYAWGNSDQGGELPLDFPNGKVISLAATKWAFIALLDDQTIFPWGSIFTNEWPSFENVAAITTLDEAVALLYTDGTIGTFGNDWMGGKIPDDKISIGKKVLSIQGKSMSPPLSSGAATQ